MSEDVREFKVGERLDKAVALAYPQYSRSALEKLILDGYVKVNHKLKRSSYRIKDDDVIDVDLSLFTQPTPEINLEIIYQDTDVVVINKPAGILTHAKGTLHNEPTVATWLKTYYTRTVLDEEFWGSNRAGIVHRLDRATSGVMICAKNLSAQKHLQKQFANRNVKKTYIAVVEGKLEPLEATVDVPIERNPKKPATFRPGINGKPAQTYYKVLRYKNKNTLVELKPLTGRTHQLRVHMKYLNHCIVGDKLYGKANKRMFLHAQKLEITLPSKIRRTFNAKVPSEFKDAL